MTITDLLDGVEPDFVWHKAASGKPYEDNIFSPDDVDACALCHNLYSRETVEALLEANRKQVLLEAARAIKYEMGQAPSYNILRRMAIEHTGVDKGEKE
jgi:hypothetical protein